MIQQIFQILEILLRPLFSVVEKYVDVFADIIEIFNIRFIKLFGVEIDVTQKRPSIDERLAKIDSARSSLNDVLNAMDEIKKEAESNKKEVAVMEERLAEIVQTKQSAEKELAQLKAIITSDIETFRKVAGIPTSADIRRGRLLGFASGVVASILAATIVWGCTIVGKYALERIRGSGRSSVPMQKQGMNPPNQPM